MKYLKRIFILFFTGWLFVSTSFGLGDFCIDTSLRDTSLPWIQQIWTHEWIWEELIFEWDQALEDILCEENEYTLLVRPDGWWINRAIDQLWYSIEGNLIEEELIQIVSNQQLLEYSNCWYIQLMPTIQDINTYFWSYDFLQRHARVTKSIDYVSLYELFEHKQLLHTAKNITAIDLPP